MEHIYRPTAFRILLNILLSILLTITAMWVTSLWFSIPIVLLIGVLSVLLDYYLAIADCFFHIHITDREVVIRSKGKEQYRFLRAECSFEKSKSDTYIDGSCILMVMSADGNCTDIDCALLGTVNFKKLLRELQNVK